MNSAYVFRFIVVFLFILTSISPNLCACDQGDGRIDSDDKAVNQAAIDLAVFLTSLTPDDLHQTWQFSCDGVPHRLTHPTPLCSPQGPRWNPLNDEDE